MPFKSLSQRRLFYAKAKRGEISPETVKEWEDATPKGKKLPERIGIKKRAFVEMFEKCAFFFLKGETYEKTASEPQGSNLPEEAANSQAAGSATDYVPGSTLRGKAETGQAKGRATRSGGIANEDRFFRSSMRHVHRTSRE